MKIKHRYSFNSDEENVIRFLDNLKIGYDKGEIVTFFELFENHDKFTIISEFMNSHNAVDISDAVYTREEIENAQWLTIRSSWHNLYPQPQDDMKYRFTTYDSTDYCDGGKSNYNCGKGLVQKECFVLKKEPNWGSRKFMMLYWVNDELFISRKAEEVLRASNLKGFEIYDVLSKSKNKLEDIKQIFIKDYLPKGVSADSIEKKYICPKCNFTKYLTKTGLNCFHNEIFEGIQYDIIKTSDKFGEGSCDSKILITKKFYEVIKEAKLDRGLVFEPVVLL